VTKNLAFSFVTPHRSKYLIFHATSGFVLHTDIFTKITLNSTDHHSWHIVFSLRTGQAYHWPKKAHVKKVLLASWRLLHRTKIKWM